MAKADLEDYIKSGALMKGDDPRTDVHRLATGIPQLDEILGGGIPYRRNTLCVGTESSGKTILAQYLAAAQQKQPERAGVLLIDAEMSYDRIWWEQSGVDTAALYLCQPGSGEEAVNLMIAMLKQDPSIGMVILDSIATLSPMALQEKSAGERQIAGLATLVTEMYQRLMPLRLPIIFFAINQLRENMNGYDDVFPGGRAQRFNSHVRLHTRRAEWLKENDKRVGFVMEVHVKKNKVGEPEGICQIPFRFRGQMDLLTSYLDDAIDKRIITQAGPWYSWGDRAKWMGKTNMRNHFLANPAELDELKAATGG